MESPPFLVVAQGNRRGRSADVPEFIGNDVRGQGCQVRAIGVHAVEPVFREEHDCRVSLHPCFRADNAHLFGNPLQRPSRGRVALNHPQAPRREAEQVFIQAGNYGQGAGTDVRSQGQLERQRPLPVTGIHPEAEVAVHSLPAHVDGVVLPGKAQPVAVDRPERAIRRNRAGHGS